MKEIEGKATPTYHDKLAVKVKEAFEQAAAMIPGWNDKLVINTKTSQRVVSRQAIVLAINVVNVSPELAGAEPNYATEALEAVQYARAYEPLIDALVVITRKLGLQIRVRETKAGHGALRILQYGRRIAPGREHLEVVVEHLEAEVRRHRRYRRPSRRQTTTEPTTP